MGKLIYNTNDHSMKIERPKIFSGSKVDVINYFKDKKLVYSVIFWIGLAVTMGFGFALYKIRNK